jgi:hypothetical protein
MENLLAVTFEAHNADLNHHRRYEIRVGRDLFGEWTVAFRYGRTRKAGQEIRHSGGDPMALRRLVQECLHRRLTAPRRIGCSYRLGQVSLASGFDVDFWLPQESLAGFH